jgi:hypothetical protein
LLSQIADREGFFFVPGNDLTDLRDLALRLDRPLADAGEKRCWQNRINLICSDALNPTDRSADGR